MSNIAFVIPQLCASHVITHLERCATSNLQVATTLSNLLLQAHPAASADAARILAVMKGMLDQDLAAWTGGNMKDLGGDLLALLPKEMLEQQVRLRRVCCAA